MDQLHNYKRDSSEIKKLKQLIDEKNKEINKLRTQLEKKKIKYKDKLQELRDYYESIIALLPGHIYWMDKNNVFLGCNDLQAKNAGLKSRKEIVGKTNHDMLWKNQADELNKLNLKVMEMGEAYTAEEYAVMANGLRSYLSQKVPLHNKKGEIIGILGISFDITERKRLEESLKEAKEKAEESSRLKTEFMRNMEHDVRTPFNGIYGIASVLYKKEELPEKKELLSYIVNSAKELLDYCNSILDFSKIEVGSSSIIEKKFYPEELINGILVMEKPALKFKKLELQLEYSNEIPTILIGDEYRLKRILINLISNAIKFTQEGQIDLIIGVAKKEDKKIILRFVLQDTGIGIPADKQLLIYEKFARLEPSNKGIYKGLGLGLRIVKQFVEEIGGEIDLYSELGKGTTFICTLM